MPNLMFTDKQIQELIQPLNQDRVAKRSDGKQSLSYLGGYDVIDTANRIFGFGMWGRGPFEVIKHNESETAANNGKRYDVNVVVKGCVYVIGLNGEKVEHWDVGSGSAQTYKGYADGYEKAYKEALTDLFKRCLRAFGNQFGNSLYSKDDPLGAATAAEMEAANAINQTQYDRIGALVGQLGLDATGASSIIAAEAGGKTKRTELTAEEADRVIRAMETKLKERTAA